MTTSMPPAELVLVVAAAAGGGTVGVVGCCCASQAVNAANVFWFAAEVLAAGLPNANGGFVFAPCW